MTRLPASRVLQVSMLFGTLCVAMSVVVYAQVNGHLTLGQSGSVSGALTLMPPDGTGWYHIDNAGDQRLRISGGGRPGVYPYMTISHPGKVTVHGDLEVTGTLLTRTPAVRAPTPRLPVLPQVEESQNTADDATSGDVQLLQSQVDRLALRVNDLVKRVNELSR